MRGEVDASVDSVDAVIKQNNEWIEKRLVNFEWIEKRLVNFQAVLITPNSMRPITLEFAREFCADCRSRQERFATVDRTSRLISGDNFEMRRAHSGCNERKTFSTAKYLVMAHPFTFARLTY
jgi:hypothetical protein